MSIEPFIRLLDQLFVECFLATSGLVASYEQNPRTIGVKAECHTPYPIVCIKSKFLHVRVFAAIQCVHSRTTQRRTELRQQLQLCEQFVLNSFG